MSGGNPQQQQQQEQIIKPLSICAVCLTRDPHLTPALLPGCIPYHAPTPRPYATYLLDDDIIIQNDVVNGKKSVLEKNMYASTCVIPTRWTPFSLLSIHCLNHDTSIFTFALFSDDQSLNLPAGGFFLILAPNCEHGGGDAIRAYTSVSAPDVKGRFDVCIKRYDAWGEKKYPYTFKPSGAVSSYVHRLKPGQQVLFKHVSANLRSPDLFVEVKSITMIAVGAGLSAMINTLYGLLFVANDKPESKIQVVLIYGNRSVQDVLMKSQLLEWQTKFKDRFRVVFVVGSRYHGALFFCCQMKRLTFLRILRRVHASCRLPETMS